MLGLRVFSTPLPQKVPQIVVKLEPDSIYSIYKTTKRFYPYQVNQIKRTYCKCRVNKIALHFVFELCMDKEKFA